jgi:hypothetical protein
MTLGRALQQTRALAHSRLSYTSVELHARVLFVQAAVSVSCGGRARTLLCCVHVRE